MGAGAVPNGLAGFWEVVLDTGLPFSALIQGEVLSSTTTNFFL